MQPTTIAAQKVLKELGIPGGILEIVRARKSHKCNKCGLPINPGEKHYCIYRGGGGLGSIKFPDRFHITCPSAPEKEG